MKPCSLSRSASTIKEICFGLLRARYHNNRISLIQIDQTLLRERTHGIRRDLALLHTSLL